MLRQAARCPEPFPTLADALVLVRRELWARAAFCVLVRDPEVVEVPRDLVERLTGALCYAA